MKPKKDEFEKQTSPSTPDAGPERNRIAERHAKEHPEGDPSVRRIAPERGTAGGRAVKLGKKKGPEGGEKKAG